MIGSIIKLRMEKTFLNEEYKQQFTECLQRIEQKYRDSIQNKPLIIKKVCQKYIKICNSLITTQPIQQSLAALQFIKALQLDIYEGKSYELYLIKISLHLMTVKCIDVQISKCKYFQDENSWKRKRQVYLERLKIFVQEVQKCYFADQLVKDYYSNLQLVIFMIIKHQLQKVLILSSAADLELTVLALLQIKKYINKVFQLLKCHILELNEMLFYLQKKVYEVLTAKVNLMIQLFVIEAQLLFLEIIILKQDGESRKRNKTLKQINTKENIELNSDNQDDKLNQKSLKNNDSNFQDSSISSSKDEAITKLTFFEKIKQNFTNEHMEQLWEKYDSIFNKIPNNIDQSQVFQKVQNIMNSYTNYVNKDMKKGHLRNQKDKTKEHLSDDQESPSQKSNLSQQPSEQTDEISSRKKHKKQCLNMEIRYKTEGNVQLNDFMDFVNNQMSLEKSSLKKKILHTSNNLQNSHQSSENDNSQNQEIAQKNSSKLSLQILRKNQQTEEFLKNKNCIKTNGSETDQLNEESQTKENQRALRPNFKEVIKKSNFGLFKDMKNVFEYSCHKNHETSKLKNQLLLSNTSKQKDSIQIKSYMVPMETILTEFDSKWFKKLAEVKTSNMKIIQSMKQNEFERLRKIKSTQILARAKSESKVKNTQSSKSKSQSVFFPFVKEKTQKTSKKSSSELQEQHKLDDQSSKTIILSQNGLKIRKPEKSRTEVKEENRIMHYRSKSKKTTLDYLSMDKLKNSLRLQTGEKRSLEDKSEKKIKSKASFEGNFQASFAQQNNINTQGAFLPKIASTQFACLQLRKHNSNQ